MSIQLLSEQTVARIAAGEVIERPASVVKELLENSLDAGASSVHISIANAGRRCIRISDDGSGIPPDEIDLALTRHATSKLRDVNDLQHLMTLGFRGEALSSIAAVSHLTLTTRHREENLGMLVSVEGGDYVQRQEVGVPVGTVINVENLFFNTPARLKFLKKEITERRHIIGVVSRYAMAYPDIRITLENDDREVFRSTGTGNLADVLVRILGLDKFRSMLEVQSQDIARDGRPEISVQGFTSTTEYTRADRTQITLFVNRRWVQDSRLTYSVVQAYHSLIEAGRYPISVLMIGLPPDEVDVNVHPTKAEIRFRDADIVFTAVQRAVRQALIANQGGVLPVYNEQSSLPLVFSDRSTFQFPQRDIHRRNDFAELDVDSVDHNNKNDSTAIPTGPGIPKKPRTLPLLRVVGQVGAMYIIAEGPAGMYLIDQNAAHQRVLYEQLIDMIESDETAPSMSLTTETVELSQKASRFVQKKAQLLARFGIELEDFGVNTFRINALPAMMNSTNAEQTIHTLLEQASVQDGDVAEHISVLLASVGAVKAGQIMSQDEMENLVRKLERAISPYNAPDGSSTLLHMSGEQLAREFERMKRSSRP